MNPRLFQKDGNIPSLKKKLKIHGGMIEAAPTFHSFKLFLFLPCSEFFFAYSDSFCQDINYKLCSLKQQPNQYYLRDKVLYSKNFLEQREPVQPPASRRLRLICIPRHVPYILLGESTMIVTYYAKWASSSGQKNHCGFF